MLVKKYIINIWKTEHNLTGQVIHDYILYYFEVKIIKIRECLYHSINTLPYTANYYGVEAPLGDWNNPRSAIKRYD